MSTHRSPPDIAKRLKRAGSHPRGGVDVIKAGRGWSRGWPGAG